MTATVVRTGTTKRASRQIEEDLRRLGADLSSSAGSDTSSIAFAGLSELAEPLLSLVNELAREAAFPEAEFERERRQKLEEVKLERTQPGFLAGERLRKVLFGVASLRPNLAERRTSHGLQARRSPADLSRLLHSGKRAAGDGWRLRSLSDAQDHRKGFRQLDRQEARNDRPLPLQRSRVAATSISSMFPARCRRKFSPAATPSPAKIPTGFRSASPTACTAARSIRAW